MNNAVPQAVAALGQQLQIVHQCGEKMLDEARQAYADAGVAANVEPFIADMAGAYAWADLVVCRAGALTLAELCAVGVGSVLVPFPQAVDDHQTRNAEYLVERGAAILLKQDDAPGRSPAGSACRAGRGSGQALRHGPCRACAGQARCRRARRRRGAGLYRASALASRANHQGEAA